MCVQHIPAEDPADIREREGFNRQGSWYSPRGTRPAAFRKIRNRPLPSDGRDMSLTEVEGSS